MHDRQWVRIGFAFVLAGTTIVAASVAGCGDDNGPGAMPGNDASNDNTMPGSDTGVMGVDTGTGGDTGVSEAGEAAAPPPHAKIYVAHASETAPAVRFCFGVASAPDGGTVSVVSQFFAEPQTASAGLPYPGIFPGTGGLLDDHGIDLSTFNIAAYAIDANTLRNDTEAGGPDGTAEHNCEQLIGSNGAGGELTLGTDYWLLGIIPSGTLARGSSWVFAITGCPAGADMTHAPFCGMGYDPASSNLALTPFKLDSVTAATSSTMGAQLVHASYAWDVVKQQVSAMAGGGVTSVAAFYNLVATDAGGAAMDSGAPDTGTPDTGAPDTGSVSDASGEGGDDSSTSDATAGDAAAGDATVDSGGGTADSGGGGSDASPSDASTTPATTPILPPLAFDDPKFGVVDPMTMQQVHGLVFDGTSGLAMSFLKGGATPIGQPAALPLPVIQQLTYGASGGVAFANGMTFAFVFLGNPTAPTFVDAVSGMPCAAPGGTCVFNGRSVHFLAFPAFNQ